jgi:hypothetical protein
MIRTLILAAAITLVMSSHAEAQAIGGPEKGRPVTGDPGISSMVVMDRPDFRVLRDWAEPGAVRRMHNHADATCRREGRRCARAQGRRDAHVQEHGHRHRDDR